MNFLGFYFPQLTPIRLIGALAYGLAMFALLIWVGVIAVAMNAEHVLRFFGLVP